MQPLLYEETYCTIIVLNALPKRTAIYLCRIDSVVEALVTLFHTVTGRRPAFCVDGGSAAENLALQNIQVFISNNNFLNIYINNNIIDIYFEYSGIYFDEGMLPPRCLLLC